MSLKSRGPSLLLVLIALFALVLAGAGKVLFFPAESSARLGRFDVPERARQTLRSPDLKIEPLTAKLRAKGFNECNPHDPLGLGPYTEYRPVRYGRMLIPRVGGHTTDFGYDVLVHFHGHEAARKFLVQVARGIAFVGVELDGGGGYSRTFRNSHAFPALRESIEARLREHTGKPQAHIRHLALSAWSAGYVAIDKILAQQAPGIDAVVVLDGLHAGYKPNARHDLKLESLSVAFIATALERAKAAVLDDKSLLVVTHSQIDPVRYPSTSVSADLLLSELDLERRSIEPAVGPYAQIGTVDERGLHVWSYRGQDELAHCIHLRHLSRAVVELIEPAWGTPAMNRTAR